MQKLQDYWKMRSAKQKILMTATFLAAFIAIATIGWIANRAQLALLYGGLEPAQASEIVTRIESAGIAYELRGDSIWVDAASRDRLRVDLAAQGLPETGNAGYELLDGMSGFGTTSQMFDAAYWRAKEGELARTILALPNVKSARVHLAVDQARGYRRNADAGASVTLTTSGSAISRDQASALKYLVSSAVPGLHPDNVTVIDSQHGIIGTGEDREGLDRAAEMKRNVARILESHVGTGNAIVELNLDIMNETEQLREERIDPEQRALISQITEESSDQSSSSGPGAVTAASNLPDSEDNPQDGSQSARSQARQQENYEISTITREVSRQPGTIRRLSVAVLVNGTVGTNDQGESEIIPRSEAELAVLRELVASATGFDESRGDVITVKSLPFAALTQNGTFAQPSLLDRLHLNSLLRLALFGLFAMAILMLVLRALRRPQDVAQLPLADNSSAPAQPAPEPSPGLLNDSSDDGFSLDSFVTPIPLGTDPFEPADEPLALPSADPVARLRSMMREKHDESLKILSGWIENREKI
ncbi:flagellar basal-body MS-ring/collar protein FliF [Paracoccus onubensis]|uniref:flagellar basal-body MS-ring/collar protein FliF n=1 Tax=Paracoccus onubensis TaxID=1675788 RepID=UPI00273094D7|nr:flagellar basal-body MS-ring/collar protein FliF [Paracoccus onubensis]MDP0925752.1 flagellar basal-body MS-ring/collar protein FliF [Paracoccus onubensis]